MKSWEEADPGGSPIPGSPEPMTKCPLSVVIHGHFYQPPREDPWLETLERQPSAAPHHDWNERITNECYRAVLAARIPGEGGRIAEIVNTLRFISFNFGPTLLEWMERNAPGIYRSILDADRVSRSAPGSHGNALAQAYHHSILPLASRRDKISEVRWGIVDFRRRFGREPVGMWLPETAVDAETLDVLAQEGIAFTILAPHQVTKVPAGGLPGRFRTSKGRSISLFIYDGPLSHGVAFGSYLRDAGAWADGILGLPSKDGSKVLHSAATAGDPGRSSDSRDLHPRRLVSMATDGETFGHHHRFGEMALAAVIRRLQGFPSVRLENFASFLSHTPPREEVRLVEPSSWSCIHGVERWRSHCGCKIDITRDTQQEWRRTLRDAVEWLAGETNKIYEEEGTALLGDVWAARNQYAAAASAEPEETAKLVRLIAPRDLEASEEIRARELLELGRQSLRLFTSCGWFFDDLEGLEPLQILRYAARALELAGPAQPDLEEGFLSRIELAVSNESPPRSGRDIFLQDAKPRVSAPLRVAAGAALWESVRPPDIDPEREGARVTSGQPGTADPAVLGFFAARGDQGRFRVTHRRTGRQWVLQVETRRPSLGRVEAEVRSVEAGEAYRAITLDEVPEGFRDAIRQSLLEAVVERWVPREAREELAQGARKIDQVMEMGLISAIRSLGQRPDAPMEWSNLAVDRVRDLADLHGLLGLPIPFDAQTEFFRLLEGANPQDAARFSALREPLGFVIIE